MLVSLNYETKKLTETNQDLQTYIGSCHKESERHAAYPEQIPSHLNNIAIVTVDSDSITKQ